MFFIGDRMDDLPKFYVKSKSRTAAQMEISDKEGAKDANNDMASRTYDEVCADDTEENLDLVGGEYIQGDTHTLVRSTKKTQFARDSVLRDSMVGMREGVPGIFSGFARKTKNYSKLIRSGEFYIFDK